MQRSPLGDRASCRSAKLSPRASQQRVDLGDGRTDDREQQTQVVEGFISQKVSGIVLAPFDSRALVRPVEEAAVAGIPTVVVDSALDTTKIVSFVATDNKKGGALAADQMGKLLNKKGKVLLLRYQEGVAARGRGKMGSWRNSSRHIQESS